MKDIITHSKIRKGHYLIVTPDGRKDAHQVAVHFNTGTGEDYKEGDRAQVDIWIAGKPVYSGTFEELHGTIKAGKQMEDEGIVINGYRIKYNYYWSQYQVNHIQSMEIPQNNFPRLQDAIDYAING